MVDPLVIERKKLFEHVAAHLEAQILSGKLKPGDQLPPERDLQSRFGVGRPAIREALISLQKAGLVELTNGARARSADADGEPHLHRHGAGRAADAVDRRRAAPFPGRAHVLRGRPGPRGGAHARPRTTWNRCATRSKPTARRSATATASPAPTSRFISNWRAIARNPVFIALHDQISEWLKEQRVVTLAASGQEQIAYDAHTAIYEGIAARDPDRAEAGDARPSRPADDDVLAPARERPSRMKIGVIGDDFTGSGDIANTLAKAGARTVQYVGIPDKPLSDATIEAAVVALKTRSIAAGEAVAQSLAACRWLVRARRRADRLQILLDLRFDAAGQYRPGGGGAAGRARRAAGARLPGLSRQRPHALSGPSVRRRPPAERIRHGEAPADADDRPGHPALAVAADQAQGRPSAAARHCGRDPPSAALRLAERSGRQADRRRRDQPMPTCWRSARSPDASAGHRRLRHRHGLARQFRHSPVN